MRGDTLVGQPLVTNWDEAAPLDFNYKSNSCLRLFYGCYSLKLV